MEKGKINQTNEDINVLKRYLEGLKGFYLEIGVQYGGTLNIAKEVFDGEVYGVDINPLVADEDKEGVNIIQGESTEVAKTWTKPISALFIDGDHDKPREDFEAWEKFVVSGGLILFHDCWDAFPEIIKLCEELRHDTRFEVVKEPQWHCPSNTSIFIIRKL